MKSIMNAKFFVPVILILIGLSCVAYATWSYAGASAWSWHFEEEDIEDTPDQTFESFASVSWGGMADGDWSTKARAENKTTKSTSSGNAGGGVSGDGGGYSEASVSGDANDNLEGSSSSSICGTGNDGQWYEDAQNS